MDQLQQQQIRMIAKMMSHTQLSSKRLQRQLPFINSASFDDVKFVARIRRQFRPSAIILCGGSKNVPVFRRKIFFGGYPSSTKNCVDIVFLLSIWYNRIG
jgi:hypothetical protein